MLRKVRLVESTRLHLYEIRYYDQYGKREMIAINTVALKVFSVCGFLLTTVFFAISFITGKWAVTWHISILLIFFAVTILVVFLSDKQAIRNYCYSQTMGVLFQIILAVLLISIGILYDSEGPYDLFSIYLIVLPIFFTSKTWIVAAISTVTGSSYCVLAYFFKTPAAAAHDIFTTVLCMLLSIIILEYFARFRAKNFIAMGKYVKLSRTDLLTGIMNKRSYELWCQKLLDECKNNEACALAIFDIDNFKQINDNFGHIMGDKVLEIVGQTLSANFCLDSFVGRIGGDEFSAFVCTQSGCEMLSRRAENAVIEVEERSKKELKIDVTMSLGISDKKSAYIDYMGMYFDADMALYKFKRSNQDERVPTHV